MLPLCQIEIFDCNHHLISLFFVIMVVKKIILCNYQISRHKIEELIMHKRNASKYPQSKTNVPRNTKSSNGAVSRAHQKFVVSLRRINA